MQLKLALFLTVLLFLGCIRKPDDSESPPIAPPDSNAIALYSDRGCWDESVVAAEKMFQWMGYTVTLVDADFLNARGLDRFALLCVPGGDMYQYAQDISSKGKENIANFISHGRGYVGICGGAYFASERVVWRGDRLPMTSLRLFAGTAEGPVSAIVPYPDYGMCKVNIADSLHPIAQGEQDFGWILYYWGPILIPNASAQVTILGKYDAVNQPATVVFEYGQGRVFLIGAHPEIEEDSDRDGVAWADELDDRGSDWEFMKRAVSWCLRQETSR